MLYELDDDCEWREDEENDWEGDGDVEGVFEDVVDRVLEWFVVECEEGVFVFVIDVDGMVVV